MNKLEIFIKILDFLPELFPPDLSAITLSNCTHFVGIWGRPGNTLGQSLKSIIYPGKPLIPEVMLGQVLMQKAKITKYYTAEESVSGIPYLAVGVPIYEEKEIIGGICAVREETILETQERCKTLLESQNTLALSMSEVSSHLSELVNSYREVRKISELIQGISQKASCIGLYTTLEATQEEQKGQVIGSIIEDLQNLSSESKKALENIVDLLSAFDKKNVALFTSIRQIETVVGNTSHTVNDIMDYLAKQSHMIIKGN